MNEQLLAEETRLCKEYNCEDIFQVRKKQKEILGNATNKEEVAPAPIGARSGANAEIPSG